MRKVWGKGKLMRDTWTQCPVCKGLGKVDGKKCAKCKGKLGVKVGGK